MKGVGTFLVKLELDQSAKKTKKIGEKAWGQGWAWLGFI